MEPRLANPLRSGGRRPAWYWAAGIAVLGGLVAAVAVAPLAGLAVGAVLLLGLLVDRSRVLLVLGALGLIALTGVVMARGQFIHRFVPDINWPAHFPVANSLTWLAICLLAADAIVVAVRLRRSSGRSDQDDGPPSRRKTRLRSRRTMRARRSRRPLTGAPTGGRRRGEPPRGRFSRARPRRRPLTGPASWAGVSGATR